MIGGTVAERVDRTTGIYTMYLEALERAGATPILIPPTQLKQAPSSTPCGT